jgi:MioC protein
MASSSEEILVLYGSQTGNSEAAAEQLSSLIPSKLSTSSDNNRTLTSRCMHLDDFLELEHAQWTRLVIIVCSSYGVGQAPIGARKFREVCDTILERFGYDDDDTTNDDKNNKGDKMLTGVTYALLGLGDSHYTTFFRNPTTIENALSTAGATRVGELGKADASGTGNMEQSKVIERWINSIWKDLQTVIDKPMTEEDELKLKKAHEQTWKLCLELYKEWKPTNYYALIGLFLPLGAVVMGILVHLYLHGYTWGN